MTNYERLIKEGELGTFIRDMLNITSCTGTKQFMEKHHMNQKEDFPNYGERIADWLQSECEFESYIRSEDVCRILDEAESNNPMLSGITCKDYILHQLAQCEVKLIYEAYHKAIRVLRDLDEIVDEHMTQFKDALEVEYQKLISTIVNGEKLK